MLAVALHGELLEVGGEALEVLHVGEDGDCLGVEEVGVPDGEEAEEGGEVFLDEARCGSVRPSLWKPLSMAWKLSGPMAIMVLRPMAESMLYRPPTQSEKGNMLAVSMPNFPTAAALVDMAAKCFAMADFGGAGLEEPVACGLRVGHGFERGEGLGGDEEEGFFGVEVEGGFYEVGGVYVRDEAEGFFAVAVVSEGFVGHDGAEVGAAYADVDYVFDGLVGVALPFAGADLLREGGHLVEDFVDFGDYVFAVDVDDGVFGGAEGCVEDGAVLGDVDLFAGEHGFGAGFEAGFFGYGEEEFEGLVGDAVFAVVEEEAFGFEGVLGAAAGVLGEEVFEGGCFELGGVGGEVFPGLAVGEGGGGGGLGGGHGVPLRWGVSFARVNHSEE